MLTFKNKEEEEFWKQMVIASVQSGAQARCAEADFALEALRLRQPVQQSPEIEK